MERSIARNWAQRYLIQHELNKRRVQSFAPEEAPVDPLTLVKQHYNRRFLEELGKPGNLRASDVPHPYVTSLISNIVENAANQNLATYNHLREVAYALSPDLQGDTEQYLNRLISELGRTTEDIIDLTVLSMARRDPLMETRIGRLLRRVVPSPEKKTIIKVSRDHRREVDRLAEEFRRDIAQKYKR